jgi:hypothetical protein
MNKNEIFENLVRLRTNVITADFSDDFSAPKLEKSRYEDFLGQQDFFTDEEIRLETFKRWNANIAKMNEEYRKKKAQE